MDSQFDKGTSLRQLAVETYGATPFREHADFGAVLERLKAAPVMNLFQKFLADPKGNWLYVEGDVEVAGDLFVDAPVVIGGSLKVAGIYDDYANGIGHAVVMGNLEAEHVLTWCELGVVGDLKVRGLIYACYNDHVVEIAGKIEARAFVINDKSCEFNSKQMKVDVFAADYSWEDSGGALRTFHPDLMFASLEPTRFDPEFELGRSGQMPNYRDCQERLWAGKPIFRDAPADPEFLDWVEEAMTLDAEDEEDALKELVGRDALVDQIVQHRLTPEPEPEPYVPPTRDEIAAILASEDEWDRRQALEHHDALIYDDFAALCRDEADYTRRKCAEALTGQVIGKRQQTLSNEERFRLAEILIADADAEVRAAAAGALPVASQERCGFEALNAANGDLEDDENKAHRYMLRRLAWFTPSETLQLAIFDSGFRSLFTMLASNPYLAISTQRRIQGLLPQVEAAGVGSEDAEDLDMAIAFMLDNKARDPGIAAELAKATLGHTGRTSILHSWRTSAVMNAELVEILRDAVDENMRYEWPEMVLGAPDATRVQLSDAITILATQDSDQEQLAWIASLASLDDDAFFAALRLRGDEVIAPSSAVRRSSEPLED